MLTRLFDYQRFEQNECLTSLIEEAEDRFTAELSDQQLSLVSAAGEPDAPIMGKSDVSFKGEPGEPFKKEWT